MMRNIIDFALIWIIVFGGVMVDIRISGLLHINDNNGEKKGESAPNNNNTDLKEETAVFEDLLLNTVKTKMLMKLGLNNPPKLEQQGVAMLRDDATYLPLSQHDTVYTRSVSVAKKLEPDFGKLSKVIIFAELGSVNQCDVPQNFFPKSYTTLTFKLTKHPSLFGQGYLMYRANEKRNTRSRFNIWACSCNYTGLLNSYSDNSTAGAINKTPDGSGCQLLSLLDSDNNVEAITPTRKRWSQFHLTGNWTSVISNLIIDSEFKFMLVFDGKIRFSANKRPFLVLDGLTEPPEESGRDASLFNSNDCLPSNVGTQDCCRARFWVDMEKLGWSDWIFSPKGFYFYHCIGKCDGFSHINKNSLLEYGHVLNAYMKRIKFNIKPCCVPKTLSHLPIVITTDGQTINRTYIPHFIVENCSCFGFSKSD